MATPQWESLQHYIASLNDHGLNAARRVLHLDATATVKECISAAFRVACERAGQRKQDRARHYGEIEQQIRAESLYGAGEQGQRDGLAAMAQAFSDTLATVTYRDPVSDTVITETRSAHVPTDTEARVAAAEAYHNAAHETPQATIEPNAQRADAVAALSKALATLASTQVLDAAAVRAIVKEAIAGLPPRVVELRTDGETTGRIEGHVHPMFETFVKAATARKRDGFMPNVWLYGPPGSGKSTAAAMLAKLLDRPFLFNGPVSMEHQLIGWRDGMGNLHEVPFTEAYAKAAVYCMDDVDKCPTFDPFLTLQAALANGHVAFAKGITARHRDAIICATGNTIGKTSADFASSNIDAAFLDRFDVRIFWDYDETLERHLYGAKAADIVQEARRAAKAKGFTGLYITPRSTAAIAALLNAGFDAEKAKDMTYRATLTADQRKIIP